MTTTKFNLFKKLGIAVLGAYVLSGSPHSNATSAVNSDVIAQETTQESAPVAQATAANLDFEVCAAVDGWQRPSDEDQAKQLGEDVRYGAALETDDALKRASTQFWDHDAISFTTYGLSARLEPVNLSGLWTVSDELWDCYEPEATVAINEGDRAETWLLNQRITDLTWENDRYVMTVEPAATGMQVVQFDRVDELASLPLEIVTDAGSTVEVVSGDWQ